MFNCRVCGVCRYFTSQYMAIFLKNHDIGYYTHSLQNLNHIKTIANEQIQIGETIEDKVQFLIFFQSIASVTEDYLHYYPNELTNSHEDNKKKTEPLLERTFAYELYRQWCDHKKAYEIPLRVDAEIGKKITIEKIDFSKIKELKGDYKEPDLVLHASQGNTDNQTIICEIKRNEQLDEKKIGYDILKICHYLDPNIWGGNPYKYGCFIVIHKEFEELSKQVLNAKSLIDNEIKEKDLKPDFSHILCITYNGQLVCWDLLSNIFKI